MSTQMTKEQATAALIAELSVTDRAPNKEKIEELLKAGADVNATATDKQNLSLLRLAIVHGCVGAEGVAIVKLLIDHGATVNEDILTTIDKLKNGEYKDDSDAQARLDVISVVVKAKLENKDINQEVTAALIAELSVKDRAPNKEKIETFLKAGADVNATATDKQNLSLLRLAIVHGCVGAEGVAIVKLLIDHGATVNEDILTTIDKLKTGEYKDDSDAQARLDQIKTIIEGALASQDLTTQLKELAVGNDGKLKGFNEDAKNKLKALLDKAQIPGDKHAELLELAVKTGHYHVVELVIDKMATDADEAKKKEKAQALKTRARDKAGALQTAYREAYKEKNPAEADKSDEDIKTPYDVLVKQLSGADEDDKENPAEKPDFARGQDVTLSDWYAAVASKWKDMEAASRALIEKDEKDYTEEDKKIAARAKQESEIAAKYTKLHELEAKLTDSNISAEEKRNVLNQLASTSSELMRLFDGYNQEYSDVLSEKGFNNQQKVLSHANGRYQGELSALNQTQKPKEGGRSGGTPGGNTPPTAGTTDVTIPGQLPPQVTPTDLDEKTGVVTQATIDSVAHAKHDGSQEKSWWQRNQEWIWWTLGILVIAALTFFSFRKGGWFNKDDKKSSTIAVNTNTNQNTNQNTNTGNDNTNTDNSGTTNDSTNDTLANNSQLYSAKEINQAIAANRQNIGNQDR